MLFTLLRDDSHTQSINNDGLLVTHSRTIFIYAQNEIVLHDCYPRFCINIELFSLEYAFVTSVVDTTDHVFK